MTINLSDDFKTARQALVDAIKNGESEDVQAEAYENMLNELFEETKKQAKLEAEKATDLTTADKQLNASDRKFYNEINKEVGYKEEKLIPEETIDRIFENLKTEHPLLSAIGLKNAGLRLKFLKSETKGQAVWGKSLEKSRGNLMQRSAMKLQFKIN